MEIDFLIQTQKKENSLAATRINRKVEAFVKHKFLAYESPKKGCFEISQ